MPELARVQNTDTAEIGVFEDRLTGRTIVVCAIDNLGKGAAGQAVQNVNLLFGFAETAGPAALGRARVSVTAAQGFVAAGVHAGIRRERPDVALLRSTVPAVGAAMWTVNRVLAAPVVGLETAPRRRGAAGGRRQRRRRQRRHRRRGDRWGSGDGGGRRRGAGASAGAGSSCSPPA